MVGGSLLSRPSGDTAPGVSCMNFSKSSAEAKLR